MGAPRADVTLWYGGAQRKAYSLRCVTAAAADRSEFAMMAMYRGDVWTSPAWLDVWTALRVGHFYLYYNGGSERVRAEAPDVLAALERDPRVTLHAWPFPMRSVIQDPTGTSKLPEVNKVRHDPVLPAPLRQDDGVQQLGVPPLRLPPRVHGVL